MEPSLTFPSSSGFSYLASYRSPLKEAQTVSWRCQVAQWMSGGVGVGVTRKKKRKKKARTKPQIMLKWTAG